MKGVTMGNTWDLVKTVAGAFVIVYAIQGGWEMAKEKGRREALAEMEAKKGPTFMKGNAGEAIRVSIGGKEYKLYFEEIES